MKEDFAAIFNAIDQKLEEIKQKPEGNINLSADSNDEGEDLMETNEEQDRI